MPCLLLIDMTTNLRNGHDHLEKIQPWRFYWDWLSSTLPILGLAYFCETVSFAAYPIAVYIIGNRFFRLSILGHEGVHGLISRSRRWNDFLARYFCHFPTFISHSRYKSLHLLHHRYLGTQSDPDVYIFEEFPEPFRKWAGRIVVDLLIGRILYHFLAHFSELQERIGALLGRPRHQLAIVRSDFIEYCVFWILLFTAISHWGVWYYATLYYFLPAYLHLPIIQIVNGMQHGAFHEKIGTRSQIVQEWMAELTIPLHLNLHYEHHLNTKIPHYNLPSLSSSLREQQAVPPNCHMSLADSVKILFRPDHL